MISTIAIRHTAGALARRNVRNLQLTCLRPRATAGAGIANFSTSPQKDEQLIFMPPNLKIDTRTSASPFAGLEKVGARSDEPEDDEENNAEGIESQLDELEISEEDDDDDDDEGEYYSLENKPEVSYAIPLPERLHVPIIHFKDGSEVGTIHLSSEAFGQDPIRTDILHRCVVYLRNKKRGKRNGGARTKTIGEVSGSGKKVRNQKGGGTARAGHKRPAHWRGGAKAHGPKGSIQDYTTKLNKKVRKMGIRMALSQKLKEGNLILVDNFDLGTYKTNAVQRVLTSIAGIGGKEGISGFFVDHVIDDENENEEESLVTSLGGVDINLMAGCKNIPRTSVTNQQRVNVMDLLKHKKLVMSLSALEKLEERYGD
mmetsp:Transcript_11762/g.17820  ORF Transcript_11762/g.17820 Transcript_11762/m.17820 type:complete len:371 (-) Transcript_11762:117-1229(-)